jgi:hypothetical protein
MKNKTAEQLAIEYYKDDYLPHSDWWLIDGKILFSKEEWDKMKNYKGNLELTRQLMFNEKYKEYLPDRFNGLMLDNEEVVKYLDDEFRELIKIPNFKYYQIKSKFNWFCFYADNVSSEKRQEIENKIKEIYEEQNKRKNCI